MRKSSSADAVELIKSKGPIVFLAIIVVISVYVIAKHRDEETFPDEPMLAEMMEFQKNLENHQIKERIKEREIGSFNIESGEFGITKLGKDGKPGNLEYQKTGCRKGNWKVVAISKSVVVGNEAGSSPPSGSEAENERLSFLAYHESLPQPATDSTGWDLDDHEFSEANGFFFKDALSATPETPSVKISVKQPGESFARYLRQRETREITAVLLEF